MCLKVFDFFTWSEIALDIFVIIEMLKEKQISAKRFWPPDRVVVVFINGLKQCHIYHH